VTELPQTPAEGGSDRRSFLSGASTFVMCGGLAAGYGTLAAFAGRFVYPDKSRNLSWQVVTPAEKIPPGESFRYQSPAGEFITVTRKSGPLAANPSDDFLALSSVCPHLGCKVHWEAQNNRFFCPCHNGAFDPLGQPLAGPPKDAGQSLKRYEVRVDGNGIVQVLVPTELLG